MKSKQHGFTIVELLIVIVVIGILAAIVIVAYSAVQNQANDTSVVTDLSSVSKQILNYQTINGAYPQGFAQLATLKMGLAVNAYSRGMFNGTSWYNMLYCWPNAADPTTFALIAQSRSGIVFEAKNGRIMKVAYALTGSATTCASAGVPMDTGTNRDWFYDNDAWQSFVTKH
jgi:general secretion pathway protein G